MRRLPRSFSVSPRCERRSACRSYILAGACAAPCSVDAAAKPVCLSRTGELYLVIGPLAVIAALDSRASAA